jgi:hypothetical protein
MAWCYLLLYEEFDAMRPGSEAAPDTDAAAMVPFVIPDPARRASDWRSQVM